MNLLSLKNGSTQPVICLEVNPPKGASLDKIRARYQGKLSGLDFVNITDNALAMMRQSSLIFAIWFKNEFGVEPLVNVACRDRNILALQSDLLAGFAQGIRGIVALTGDAISIGDHPETKGVFEVNSQGLLSLIGSLNAGKDFSGNELQGESSLIGGVVANPNVRNQSAELRKLEKKVKAGARFILTQPVFDSQVVAEFIPQMASFGIPLMLGLMPIPSIRAAAKISEVPGLRLSPELEDMIKNNQEINIKEESLNLCMRLAEISSAHVAGFHVISGANPKLGLELVGNLKARFKENK